MKTFQLFFLSFLLTTAAYSEYLRTIQLGSFKSPQRISSELSRVKDFANSQKNIVDLQKIWDFEFKTRKSGSYYVIVAEPFRERDVMQEVIDTLRLEYPDAYPTKLDSAPPFKKKEPKSEAKPVKQKIVQVQQELVTPPEVIEVIEEEPKDPLFGDVSNKESQEVAEKVVEEKQEEVIKEETTLLEEPKAEETQKREPVEFSFDKKEPELQKVTTIQSDSGVYKILFYVTLFLLLIVTPLLYRYKRKNVHCKDRESHTIDLFNKKDMEIKHKDSFLSHAKNSVADINNFTNLLLEFNLSTIQKDYIQRIRSSSEHLLNTVNNTLDINKLKNGTLEIEKSEFDLNEMLRKVSKIMELEAKNNDTVFQLKVERDVPPFIFGDPTRIRQVLINLLGNSVKFTKGGNITLTVKTLYNYTHAITLGFIVKDTGIGMSSEQIDDILAPDAEIVDGGTLGVGLFVTKQLIELMNGEIKIYSNEDIGTTFTFSLKFNLKR